MKAIGLAAVALVLLVPAARADEPLDVVELTDGTVLQGRVAEWKPGAHAIIVLADGETRTVDAERIARITGPSFDRPPPPPVALDSRLVPVRIESLGPPQQVARSQQVVEVRGRRALIDKPECTTPCTLEVEPGPLELRLSGPSVAPSTTNVVVPPGGLRLKMYAAPARRWRAGLLLTLLAPGPIVAGIAYVAVGASDTGPHPSVHDTFVGLGSAVLVVGTVALVSGIVVLSTTRRGIAWRSDGARASLELRPGGLAVTGRF